jgi:hypothetical protein
MTLRKTFRSLPQPIPLLFKLVVIPALCLTPLFIAALYFLGGMDLLRFTLTQLTWKVSLRILCGFAILLLVTWMRHETWYRDDPPPMWWRRSARVNVLEIAVLLGLIFLGIWAIPRFAPHQDTRPKVTPRAR